MRLRNLKMAPFHCTCFGAGRSEDLRTYVFFLYHLMTKLKDLSMEKQL